MTLRRFQFSLKALLTETAVICIGLTALKLALSRPEEFESGYIVALAGGLVVAGVSFGTVIGTFFRQPLMGAIVGAVTVPIIGYAALETGLLPQWSNGC